MTEEKRRHVRWKNKIKVSYALTEEQELYEELFTEDISEEGMQILIGNPLELNKTVRLKLEFFNDSVPITVAGRIVYLKADGKKYRIGFAFIDMNDFQKQRIRRNLEEVKLDFNNEAGNGYA
jgi:c-di-GMP-binding flagellar brake protein YcgR